MIQTASLRPPIVLLALALVVAACGDPDPEPATAPPTTSSPTATSPTSTSPTTTSPTTSSPTSPTTPPSTTPPSIAPTTTVAPPTTTDVEPAFDRAAARADLDAARARWGAAEPLAYRMTYAPVCFCPAREIALVVVDRTRITASTDEPWGHVYDWYGEIELAIDTAFDLQVEYDDRGVPTSLYVDWDPMMADEESGMSLIELVEIDEVLAETLTVEYGCGYGFWAAAPTQQVALMVDVGETTDAGVRGLADQRVAEVRVGHDLMANWCDDVIEPDEPEPDVHEMWPLSGGTIEVTAVDQGIATAELRDVVARRPDGTEVALGDVTLVNPFWGVFAG